MKHPRIIIVGADGWLAKQLRELADESRWLLRTARSVDTALSLVRESALAVLLVQFEPAEDKFASLGFIAEAHRSFADMPIVAVADSKVSDGEQSLWTAALLDLGARYVLFPPLTKPVLEDVVSGLMAATVRRVLGEDAPLPPLPVRTRTSDDVIDLADEDAGT